MRNTFLEGKILPPLIKFAIPLMLSLFLQSLYGAVDLIVVGQFGSKASISAVATGSQLMVAVTGIVTGLTMGVTILIGQAVGAKNEEKAAGTVAAMAKLFSIVAIVLTIILVTLAKPLAVALHAPKEALDQTVDYITICGAGMIFITAYNAISGIFRGIGNSTTPFLFVTIACIINIILDLVFVAVFKLDSMGAALATVIAQAFSVIFSLIYLRRHKLPFSVTKHSFLVKGCVMGIIKVGSPIALQDFLVSISFLIITSIVNNIGLTESASIGIAEKLFVFLSIVPMSFLSALSAFVAQNVGNDNYPRAFKALRQASVVSFFFGIIMFLLTFFGGHLLARIFTKDQSVIDTTAQYFRSCSFEHLIIAVSFCMLGYFNGLKKTNFVMFQGLVSAFLVRVPLSYVLSSLPETNMTIIGFAVPISALVSLIMCIIYIIIVNRQIRRRSIINKTCDIANNTLELSDSKDISGNEQ